MLPKCYLLALVCINGHVISGSIRSEEDISSKYCETCGSRNIIRCQKCEEGIKGKFYNPRFVDLTEFDPPSYCWSCGKPYPWTESKIKTMKELIDFESNLTKEEKQNMKKNINDLINENPRTQVASMKFKKGLTKAGKETAKALRDLVIDIASKTAKEIIMGNI